MKKIQNLLFGMVMALVSLPFFVSGQDVRLPEYEVVEIGFRSMSQLVGENHRHVEAEKFYQYSKGEGTVIAILDTGVDYDHEDLRENCITKVNGVEYAKDFTGSKYGYKDVQGHGTHCAGIAAAADNGIGIIGFAPLAKILPIKVLDDTGSGSYDWIAKGLIYYADLKLPAPYDGLVKVASLSLGGPAKSEALDKAIDYAISKGVIIFVAAGNSGCTGGKETCGEPGANPKVITVGSVNANNVPSYFSSCCKSVDVVTVGEKVYSCAPGNKYVYLNGTSMATPGAAGVGALLTGYFRGKGFVFAQGSFEQFLKSKALDIHTKGEDIQTGAGVPMLSRYIGQVSDSTVLPIPVDSIVKIPLRSAERTLTIVDATEYKMYWRKQGESKYNVLNIKMNVDISTKMYADYATDSLKKVLSLYAKNRAFVLESNSDEWEAIYWWRHFLEMALSVENKLDVKIESVLGYNQGRSYKLETSKRRTAAAKKAAIKAIEENKVFAELMSNEEWTQTILQTAFSNLN